MSYLLFLNQLNLTTMKRLAFFAITTGVLPLFMLISCHQEDYLKAPNGSIATRQDCDTDCPNANECCCFVELNNDNVATIALCGTTTGSACLGSQGSCDNAPSGGGQSITLNGLNPKQIFCMDPESALRIINTSTTDNAGIRFGCNTTSVSPLTIILSPQDSVKAQTNIGCELGGC